MKQKMKFFAALCLMLSLLITACKKHKDPPADNYSNQVVLTWNEIAYETLGGPAYQHSLLASRIYALVHIAMHDAVNATDAKYQTYAYHTKNKTAHPEIAAAVAAHRVLTVSFPENTGSLDSTLNTYLSTFQESESKTAGIATGVEAADALLALGHNDNGAQNPIGQPAPALEPGDYKNVPPFDFIFAPFWEDSKLFSLQKKDQFRSKPHPAVNSNEYAAHFNEVKEVGFLNSTTRTEDQTAYAKYWYEFSESGWNRVARVVAADHNSGLFATARLFALLNMAIADSYTAGWDSKLYYNFWRPYTAIREADTDGNAQTEADGGWLPSEPTPPIQDYPSTHSVLGNAGATVLAYIYGNQTSFTMHSPTAVPAGSARSFTSFSQAADENADSRVMAGIHFRFSCEAGQEMGNKIGVWTVKHYLKPLK